MNTAATVPHLGKYLFRWLAILTMLGLGTVSLAVYLAFDHTLSLRQQEMLGQKQASLTHVLADDLQEHRAKSLRHVLTDFLAGHGDFAAYIKDDAGNMLFDSRTASLPAHHSIERSFRVSFYLEPSGQLLSANATLVMDRRPDDALLRSLAWTLFASMVAGSLILSLFGRLLVKKSLHPIKALVTQIGEITAKDLETRLDGSALPQELHPLVTQFNALLERLADAYRQLESFNADVAHELNTPLATLISSSEVVLRKPRSVEEMREVLESNLEDLRRIASIVGDMLFLSRADRGADAREKKNTRLAPIASEVADFYEAVALDANLRIEIDGDASAPVDAPMMRRALSNLLSNATRYASAGSVVTIRLRNRQQADHQKVVITVRNEGAGIEATHLRHLFERFYRADSSRHNADHHHGLGLAIVQAIAKMHGGSVFAESDTSSTRIGIILPAN